MRLSRPFYRLPVRFDAARLREEITAFPADRWARHPRSTPGNSALRLISVDGAENDEVDGIMQPTPALTMMPYLRQVLASFGVVWSRSRLMRLAPGALVTEHADINYHWHYRVRLHIPVATQPEVKFHCGGEAVHMATGEAWIFDNWRLHRVENPTDQERIHLVADTTGSAAFWRFVGQSDGAATAIGTLAYDPDQDAHPLLERIRLAPVMAPAEVDLLMLDMRAELTVPAGSRATAGYLATYHALLDAFCRDWRQLYLLHGENRSGWDDYAQLRLQLRRASRTAAADLVMRTNGVGAHRVLEARILRSILPAVPETDTPGPARAVMPSAVFDRPLIIIAAPRSGSTLLYETLAASRQLANLGGEAPWLIEDVPQLQPGGLSDSNRLEAVHATPEVASRIRESIRAKIGEGPLRLLEKTPKNSLRVAFLNRIFPEAQFIFLWRDPRESLSSIIEAWRSGRWITYRGLEGFDQPWSLLLPPGWQSMRGRNPGEIAAFQWEAANRIALNDLEQLPASRWTAVSYADLRRDPRATVGALCRFAGIALDAGLEARLAAPLPLSRYTLSSPDPDKWRRNAELIEPLLSALDPLHRRLVALGSQNPKR